MASATAPRTFAKDIRLVLGMASSTGNLKPLKTSDKADSFCILCPDCTTPTTIKQQLVCEHGHVNEPADCTDRGKLVDDVLYSLSAEDVDAARDVSKSTAMTLRFHPADQVEANTRPTGCAYAFIPTAVEDAFFGVLCELADSMSVAIVGTLVLRGREKLFRIVREAFGLSLVEVCRPEEMYSFEPVEHGFSPAAMEMMRKVVAAEMCDFDPAEYADGTAARVEAIIAAKGGNAPVTTIQPKAAPAAASLADQLAASLAAIEGAA